MSKYRTIVFCAIALLLSVLLFAQEQRPHRTPEEEAAKQTAMLAQYLTLTQEQIDTIYVIHLRYAKLRREAQQQENRRQLFEQMTFEVRQLLNEQQLLQLEKMREESKRTRERQRVMFRDSIATAPNM